MTSNQPNPRKNDRLRRHRAAPRRAALTPRFGLAPLEMIIGLPLILLLFALMINASFTGMWKLRLLGASQEATWRGRDSINVNLQNQPSVDQRARPYTTPLPPPKYQTEFWRQQEQPEETNATTDVEYIEPLEIPAHADNAKLSSAPAVREPYNAFQTITELLDPTKDMLQGIAKINRYFPLLQNGLPMLRDQTHQQITQNSFPYWNMIQEDSWKDSTHEVTRLNLNGNKIRRTKVLYDLDGEVFQEPHRCPEKNQNREKGDIGQIHPEELLWPDLKKHAAGARAALSSNLLPLTGFDVTGPNSQCECEKNYYIDPEAYAWAARLGGNPCQPFSPPAFMPRLASFSDDGIVGRRDAKYVLEKYGEPHMVRVEDEPDKLMASPPHEQMEDEFYPRRGSLPHTLAGSYIGFFQSVIKEYNKRLIPPPAELTEKQQALRGYQPNF